MPILFIVLLLTTAEQSAIDTYLPSFPAMAEFFHTSDDMIQLSLSLYMAGFAVSPLFAGPLTDRFGRKSILILGLTSLLLATMGCALAVNIYALLLGRVLMGFACGIIVVANQSMVRDSFQGKRLVKVTSYMSMAWSMVPILAPAIGGYIQHYFYWQANFYFIAFYIALSLFFVVFTLKETMTAAAKKIRFKLILLKYSYLLKQSQFLIYVACTAISFALTTAFITGAPFLFEDVLGYTPVEFGWLALIVAISYLIGTYTNNVFLKYLPINKLICSGLIMTCIFSGIGLLFGLLGYINVYVIAVPVALVIFAGGFIYPNASALAFEPINKNIGIASALYISIQLISCALSSAIVAKLPETNQIPLMSFLFFFELNVSSAIFYFY